MSKPLAVSLLALCLLASGPVTARAQETWSPVDIPGWPFAIALPDGGVVAVRGTDEETDAALEDNDLEWVAEEGSSGKGRPFRMVAYITPFDVVSDVTDTDWAEFNQGVQEEAAKTDAVTATDVDFAVAGRRWLRYTMPDDDPAVEHEMLSTLLPEGAYTVMFSFHDATAEQRADAVAAALAVAGLDDSEGE
jgi:hypothetical protein